jgi:CBS domain-containing protein
MTVRVDDFLAKAGAQPVELAIRDLLAIWGYRARTFESVARIQRDLSASGLRCDPALDEGDSDSIVRVGVPQAASADDTAATESGSGSGSDSDSADEPLVLPPAALLVKQIPSAVHDVAFVRPDQSLAEAQSLMSANDFSQLPVLAGPHDLKGAVSWRSIAQAKRHKAQITLADATKHASIVSANDELLSQIDTIYKADFVFVRDGNDRICGIITTSDLTDQFRDLTTPFFQLGEIERRLRRCINRAFGTDELRSATGNRRVISAEDLTFGQYVRLLSDEGRWQCMDWEWADCTMFIAYLDAARVVRNRVMHFGEELSPGDKQTLVRCLNFMRALDPLP